jgi:purine nucleosidase
MTPVWIDTDLGFDDLAAVLTVAASPQWRVAGLSLVAGNAPLPVVVDNALRAAHFFSWGMPIHAGCDRPLVGELVTAQNILGADAMRSAGRGLPPQRSSLSGSDAVAALAAHLRASAAPATVLALGPLTNLAVLLQRKPQLAARISSLLWMGGSAGPGNHTAAAEFNAAVDPEAVQVVLDAAVPLRMVGLDACRQVRVHASDAAALRAVGSERATVLGDLLEGYVRIASSDGSLPMALYDPVAAAALVAPPSVRFEPAHLVMELVGRHTRGMTVVERRVPRRATANALVATTVDEAAVRAAVLGALAAA